MKIGGKMKVVAYYRVSTDKQAASGLGLEAQQSAVETFCATKGWEIVSSHIDEGVSGKTETLDRPSLVEALTSIHSNKAEVLVSAKLDRLSRDVVVQRTIEKALDKLNAKFISAAGEGTDDDSPHSKLVKTILSAVAENEAALISIRTKAALQAAKDRGVFVGRPPLGFEIDGNGRLRPGSQFHLVRLVLFMRYREHLSYKEIVERLNKQEERLGRLFSITTVANVVKRWGYRKEWLNGIRGEEDCYNAPSPASV